MRTIETVLYKFEELSEEAKQVAIEEYRHKGIDNSYSWQEAHESVRAFHDMIGTREGSRSWLDYSTGHIEDAILELTKNRLRTYLLNNFEDLFYERKYRGHSESRGQEKPRPHRLIDKIAKDHKGNWYAVFRSNFKVESCCPLTGVCWDEYLLKPFKEFVKNPDGRCFEDLIQEALEELRISLENDDEYRNSDEAIQEEIENGDFEFTEEGNRY